ncbi:MAG: CopG family ribbon-helix-helix protein, partial [Cyanobacteriota bacterium]
MKPLAARQRISLELPADLLKRLDALKREWGLRSRGDLFQRLLETGLSAGTTAEGDPAVAPPEQHDSEFDEQGALVLVARRGRSGLEADFEAAPVPPSDPPPDPAADPAA